MTHLAGALHVPKGREPDVVEGVVWHVVLAQISPAVLEAPEGKRVELRPWKKQRHDGRDFIFLRLHIPPPLCGWVKMKLRKPQPRFRGYRLVKISVCVFFAVVS